MLLYAQEIAFFEATAFVKNSVVVIVIVIQS